MAFGMPINDAIERLNASARELDASAANAPAGQSFDQQIAQAVKRKVHGGAFRSLDSATAVSASSGDKGFAKRLREAAEKKSGAKRHKEQADRERECPHP